MATVTLAIDRASDYGLVIMLVVMSGSIDERLGVHKRSGVMSPPFVLRRAVCGEAAQITALVLRSKALWGYDPEFMRRAAAELVVSEQDIVARDVLVAQAGETLAGVVAIDHVSEPPEIDLLFVAPTHKGVGVGRALLRPALESARARGLCELTIASDPHAEAFYLSQGAVRVGAQRSPSTGRELPLLRIATDVAGSRTTQSDRPPTEIQGGFR